MIISCVFVYVYMLGGNERNDLYLLCLFTHDYK